MAELSLLRETVLELFRAALRGVDAQAAVRRAVHLDGTRLNVNDTSIDLATRRGGIYAVAIGKAAHAMAAALDEILSEKITAGVLAGLPFERSREKLASALPFGSSLPDRWRVFAGGHPLPNEESLAAARAAFEILRRAETERALILFLISGGGSALIEFPKDETTTLAELRETNRTLVNCGASIAEINAVRRVISSIKGGGLAAHAPHADQVSLIISDTNTGEETNVASGPTFDAPPDAPDAAAVIARYKLASRLPASILRAISQPSLAKAETVSPRAALRKHYVLLTNEAAKAAAASAARARGLFVEIADDVIEQEIGDGCAQLFERLLAARQRLANTEQAVCLLSGGEFACPVRGQGVGGRNSETVLRWAMKIGEWAANQQRADAPAHVVALSAGTDGIDGNSPAAGARCDETTLTRAQALGLDAQRFLEASDAHTFFAALGDAIVTGSTGTNVRDLRVMLVG